MKTETRQFIYKMLYGFFTYVILISCSSETNKKSRDLPSESVAVESSELNEPNDIEKDLEQKKQSEYRKKYFNKKFVNISSLRSNQSQNTEIFDLISELNPNTIERKKYYYYLLSQEKRIPKFNTTNKRVLKKFMDNLFELEVDLANFYNNSKEAQIELDKINNDRKKFRKKTQKVNKKYIKKKNQNNYIIQKSVFTNYKHRIVKSTKLPTNDLPVLSKRMNLIRYRLDSELANSSNNIIQSNKRIKKMHTEKVLTNRSNAKKMKKSNPIVYKLLKKPDLKIAKQSDLFVPHPNFTDIEVRKLPPNPSDTNKVVIFMIIGDDNRKEPYEMEGEIANISSKVLAMIPKREMELNEDGTMYKINNNKLLNDQSVNIGNEFINLCNTVKYAYQPSVSVCTGFAIAQNKLITANHCVPYDHIDSLASYYWVYDYKMDSNNSFNPMIPVSSVYSATHKIKDQYFYENDFALLELNKAVSSERIIEKIETSEDFDFGDTLFMIGHPLGLPVKICDYGLITDLFDESGEYSPFFYCSLDAFQGNSGSPVFLKSNGKCIGFLSAGLSDFERNSSFQNNRECASEFTMAFDIDLIEEMVQKMEDVYLQIE